MNKRIRARYCLFGIMIALIIGIRTSIVSKSIVAHSYQAVERVVARDEFALIFLYAYDDHIRSSSRLYYKLRQLESTFNAVSRMAFYRKAGLTCIKVNVGKRRLQPLVEYFHVTQLPALVLCVNGRVLPDGIAYGFMNRSQISTFIDKQIGDDLDDIVREQEQEKIRRLQESPIQPCYWDPYWYGYPYCSYPWYPYYGNGYGYGSGLGGWGVNIGFYNYW